MKLTIALIASANAMADGTGHGKEDKSGIHLGGGAFDSGTPRDTALWAIRKCRKQICATWPWAKCPTTEISDIETGRETRGPCCHKCWNKCPPYLARHRIVDRGIFSNAESRRDLKDAVHSFLQNDIQCETARMEKEFRGDMGHEMDELFIGQEEGVNTNGMQMDFMDFGAEEVEESEECTERLGWFQCHGHKNAHCCANSCLNNPEKTEGKCGQCECGGNCGYLHDFKATHAKRSDLNCAIPEGSN